MHEHAARAKGCVRVAGVDEAGRGPLAGPVVAAACILSPESSFPGLNDSKQLTAAQRETLFVRLIEEAVCGVGVVSHQWIDTINILQATHRAMRLAVQQLSLSPDYIFVDGPLVIFDAIPSEGIIGGDAISCSIAAASVIAKVMRDRIMENYHRLYPDYGYARHKGYGTVAHREALTRLGPSPIQRHSFRIRNISQYSTTADF